MAEGKWIAGLTPDAPLAKAAEIALSARLQAVGDVLPKAAQESDKDPEHVHQLRVAARRADAVLRIFESCLPKKVHKEARKRLRRLRRAAGAARDWDVFLTALAERRPNRPEKNQTGLDFLFGYAFGQRATVQGELESVGTKEHSRFDAFRRDTTAAVHAACDCPSDANLLDLGRSLLAGFLLELEWAAAGDLSDYSHLHQERIAGKRLRYAMEVFAYCFTQSFRDEFYPRVEEMQEILGRANDSHVAEERLTDLRRRMKRGRAADWKRAQAGVERLLRFHQRRLPRERKRFVQWWEEWQRNGAPALTAMLKDEAAMQTPSNAAANGGVSY